MKILAELDVKMGKLKEKSSLVKLEMPNFFEKFPKKFPGVGEGRLILASKEGMTRCPRAAEKPFGLSQ